MCLIVAHLVIAEKQALQCYMDYTPVIRLLVFFSFCGGYDFVDEGPVDVDSDDISSLPCAEMRRTGTSQKRKKTQSQATTLSPIADECGETSTDVSQQRRSKR